jgi:hypothetical protein
MVTLELGRNNVRRPTLGVYMIYTREYIRTTVPRRHTYENLVVLKSTPTERW